MLVLRSNNAADWLSNATCVETCRKRYLVLNFILGFLVGSKMSACMWSGPQSAKY